MPPLLREAPLVDTPPTADEMKVEQAAERLGQTLSTVRRACQTGALPAVRRLKPGSKTATAYWVRADDLARYEFYLSLRPFPMGRPKQEPGATQARPVDQPKAAKKVARSKPKTGGARRRYNN